MRFGASTFIWASPFGGDPAHLGLFEHVKGLGFDVLEICIEDPALIDVDAIGDAARGAGVGVNVCGAFGPNRDVSSDDPAVRAQGAEYLRTCVDIAARLGSELVSGPMYSATGKTRLLPPEERARQRTLAADGIRAAADHAASRGVALAIEPLNRFETDLVNTVHQGLELLDEIGRDNAGLLLDTFHMNIEEKDVADAIRAADGRIFELHACENDRGTPGHGHVDWDEVFDALVDVGFDGLVAIESFTPEIEEIARAVSTWRPVATSGDALAGEGLTFLKGELARRGVVAA